MNTMDYIPLRSLSRKRRPKKDYTPFIIALLVLFVLALYVEIFYINPYITLIETTNASGPYVNQDHCARFGITL